MAEAIRKYGWLTMVKVEKNDGQSKNGSNWRQYSKKSLINNVDLSLKSPEADPWNN